MSGISDHAFFLFVTILVLAAVIPLPALILFDNNQLPLNQHHVVSFIEELCVLYAIPQLLPVVT